MGVWLVWGTVKGSLLTRKDHKLLVLAGSGAEARKAWREHLYKNNVDVPGECEAKRVDGNEDLKSMVIGEADWNIEYALGLHD